MRGVAKMANVWTVFRIRDIHPGSEYLHPGSRSKFCPSQIKNFSIPDQYFFHPRSASKNLTILTQKWFLRPQKYDDYPGSWIQYPDPDFLPIPDPGVKKAPDPRSWIRIRNTVLVICLGPWWSMSSCLLILPPSWIKSVPFSTLLQLIE